MTLESSTIGLLQSRAEEDTLISSTGQFVSFSFCSTIHQWEGRSLSCLFSYQCWILPLVPVHPINSISWKDPWHIHSSSDFSFHITTTIVLLISPPSESILYLSPFFFPLLVWSLSVWHPTSLQFLISFFSRGMQSLQSDTVSPPSNLLSSNWTVSDCRYVIRECSSLRIGRL